MAQLKIRHLIERRYRDRPARFYWQPSKRLAAAGWRAQRLSDERALAIEEAERLNAEVDAWRAGVRPAGGPPAPAIVRPDTVADVIRRYTAHRRFTALAERTRTSYRYCFGIIEAWAGDAPVRAIDRRLVQLFYEDLLGQGKHARANAVLRVLGVVLKFAHDFGYASENAAARPGLVGLPGRIRVWSDAELAATVEAADALERPSIGDAVLLALWTAQRKSDLLALTWLQLEAGRIELTQSKRRARVSMNLAGPAAERLEAARRRLRTYDCAAPQVLVCESTGRGYTPWHFTHCFAEVRAAAAREAPSVADAWFMDLRDTAVTRLARAGNTIPQICAVTGHSEAGALGILRHYLALDGALADAAIENLVKHRAEG